ncbi:MAG: OmpA family protein [Bacteroidia bacterium]|nr:OmpA family protein [Bacteroidia bacterium]MDW8345725.1 OmpA family protein [Bacteroidia bacterium]
MHKNLYLHLGLIFWFFWTSLDISIAQDMLSGKYTEEDGFWQEKYVRKSHTPEAEWMIRIGDIDNLGFGFDKNYNPFSGDTNQFHPPPSVFNPNEPQGLDMILLPTSFRKFNQPCIYDVYSSYFGFLKINYKRVNFPIQIPLNLPPTMPIQSVKLMIFIDDIQSKVSCSKFDVWLNQKPAYFMAEELKKLNLNQQGKLLTFDIPPSYFEVFKKDTLELIIDDITTGAGDGFAIDFIKILVNPRIQILGELSGHVTEKYTGKLIEKAILTTQNNIKTETKQGKYVLSGLPIGSNVITVSAQNYRTETFTVEVTNTHKQVNFQLTQSVIINTVFPEIGNLTVGSKIILKNTHFAPNSTQLKKEVHTELEKLAELMRINPTLKICINGHTDSGIPGTREEHLLYLSEGRARSVMNFLISKGVEPHRITCKGYGSTKPIADNKTPENQAKNRRVEFEIIDF